MILRRTISLCLALAALYGCRERSAAEDGRLADTQADKRCLVDGVEVTTERAPADFLTEQEREALGRLEAGLGAIYAKAVEQGRIVEGYKWFSNWWQGVNEICRAVTGTSPGAASGYKCTDKQNEMISGIFDSCGANTFCVPKPFYLVKVDYNVGWPNEHHFLAVVAIKDGIGYHVGNVDPWLFNHARIVTSTDYRLILNDGNYSCSVIGAKRCCPATR